MKKLSEQVSEGLIRNLKKELASGNFPGVRFEQAMQFLLTDGILPATGLRAASFLELEDWARSWDEAISYTTSDLKNRTGEIVERVLEGKTIRLLKHGRAIAEIRKIES